MLTYFDTKLLKNKLELLELSIGSVSVYFLGKYSENFHLVLKESLLLLSIVRVFNCMIIIFYNKNSTYFLLLCKYKIKLNTS